jgi:hypothetical protein
MEQFIGKVKITLEYMKQSEESMADFEMLARIFDSEADILWAELKKKEVKNTVLATLSKKYKKIDCYFYILAEIVNNETVLKDSFYIPRGDYRL